MFGQRVADRFAAVMGSWPFILGQSAILAVWVALNVVAWIHHWDPYPFILLNLMLSFQAAYAAPIIMMSQNRQEERDRQRVIHILRLAEAGDRANDMHEDLLREVLALLREQRGESAAARNARAAAGREEG